MHSSYGDIFWKYMKEGRTRYWCSFQCLTSGNGSAVQSSVAVEDWRVRCSRKGMNNCAGKYLVVGIWWYIGGIWWYIGA